MQIIENMMENQDFYKFHFRFFELTIAPKHRHEWSLAAQGGEVKITDFGEYVEYDEKGFD